MQSAEAAGNPIPQSGWLGNLAMVVIQPRRTMRELLDQRSHRMVVPLVLLAIISSLLKDLDLPGLQKALQGHTTVAFPLMIACILVAVTLVTLLLFYVLSWIALGVGRLLEGRGEVGEVRSALAWGFAPIIWALLYRIPMAFIRWDSVQEAGLTRLRLGGDELVFSRGNFPGGWATALAFAILEITVLLWYLVIASRTLAEAHRFSGWRGLGTLVLSFASPVIVILAAVLAMAT